MANNRNLAALGYLPSLNNGVAYGVVNGKWAAVSSGPTVTAWTNITLASGMAAGSPPPQYRKNGDIVEFRGCVVTTAARGANLVAVLFTAPVGFRATYGGNTANVICAAAITNSTAIPVPGALVTDATGVVYAQASFATPANSQVTLEGLYYSTLA